MKVRTSILAQLGILAVTLAISAYYSQILPDRVPTHWNIHNEVDQYGSKWISLAMGPGMALFGLLLTVGLPKISPKNFEIDKFSTTFAYAMFLVSAFFLYLTIVILRMTAGAQVDFVKGMMAGMFIFFALIGNVMGKVRKNFFMGVRTPWTLASEPVWDATHRFAGHLWVVGGFIGAAAALLGAPLMFSVILLVVIGFWPVVLSYFLYRKLA